MKHRELDEILGLPERLLSLKSIRQVVEKTVIEWFQESQVSTIEAKVEFLASLAECFPKYFNETYEAVMEMKHQSSENQVSLE